MIIGHVLLLLASHLITPAPRSVVWTHQGFPSCDSPSLPSALWGSFLSLGKLKHRVRKSHKWILFFFSECCQLIRSIKKDVFTAVCFRGSGESLNFYNLGVFYHKGSDAHGLMSLECGNAHSEPCHSDLAFVVTLGSRYVTLVNLSPRVRRPRRGLVEYMV